MVPARFSLRAEDVLDRATKFCAHWRSRNPPLDSPLHKDLVQLFREADELERACQEGREVEWAGDNPALRWCSWLVFNRRFVQALCPDCARAYSPEQCTVLEWSLYGDARAAIGGKRLICPNDHTLYSCDTWVS